jgi:exopolysaccharide biosynthesis protein
MSIKDERITISGSHQPDTSHGTMYRVKHVNEIPTFSQCECKQVLGEGGYIHDL